MHTTKLDTLIDSIRKLSRRGADQNVRKILEKLHAADVAYIFRYFNDSEQLKIFRLIEDTDVASEILSQLDTPTGVGILTRIERELAAEVLQAMESDDELNLLQEVPEHVREEILSHMPDSDTEAIEELFQYPADSAGRLMNTDYFALEEEVAVSEAINELQKRGEDGTEMVFYVYVVDKRNHLLGVCSLRQLLLVPPSTPIKTLMTQDVVSVSPETDQAMACWIPTSPR